MKASDHYRESESLLEDVFTGDVVDGLDTRDALLAALTHAVLAAAGATLDMTAVGDWSCGGGDNGWVDCADRDGVE